VLIEESKAGGIPQLAHWTEIPSHVDMSCYASWYQKAVERCVSQNPVVVEAGVRYGCSARIIADTLADRENWQLYLIDPVPTTEASQVPGAYPKHVISYKGKGERLAGKFEDGSVDLLHIDADVKGDHPYEMALQILLAFWWKLKPTGAVILHDCTDHFATIKRLAGELVASGQWEAEYAQPQPECPISAPCLLRRKYLVSDSDGLTAVVPIIKKKWLKSILSDIQNNTVWPDEILVIDNSNAGVGESVCEKFPLLPIRYLSQETNLGVNASWNLGAAEAKTELVSILNDDLELPSGFFESTIRTFESVQAVGLVAPQTGIAANRVYSSPDEPFLTILPQREGWAFTMRKSLYKPIPDSLVTFCGDDFLYQSTIDGGNWCVKDEGETIFHHVGISRDVDERKRLSLPTFQQERAIWNQMLADRARRVELNTKKVPVTSRGSAPFLACTKDWWEIHGVRVIQPADLISEESATIQAWIARHNLTDKPILEVGSGVGQVVNKLRSRGIKLSAYIACDNVNALRFRFRERMRVLPDYWDGRTLPYSDGAFDAVWSLDVLQFVPEEEIDAFLKEQVRVSSKFLIVSAYVQGDRFGRFISYTLHDYDAMFEHLGLKVEGSRATDNGKRRLWLLTK
jgi:SAM-dependent methyltransferase